MSEHRTLGTAILDLLAMGGVDVAFGLPGVHNLALWSAETNVRIVGVRHEQAAVYAADAFARATGKLGVALTTTGPGAINGLAAFGEASVSCSPILVISSDVSWALRDPQGPRGILHEMADQAAPFASFGGSAVTATTAHEAISEVAAALARAGQSPTLPSYIGIPSDVLNAPFDEEIRLTVPAAQPDAVVPSESDVAALAASLNSSSRIVIWAGGGVVQAEAEDALRMLAERLSAPVVTTYAGRGLLAGHPLAVEASVHEPEVGDLVASADLLLVVGSNFDAMHTKNWKMAMPATRAAIGLGPQLARTIAWDHLLAADARLTLESLTPLVEGHDPWADTRLRAPIRARMLADPRTTEPAAFVAAVETWPEQGVVVTDMCMPGYWTSSHAAHPRTRRLINPVGWGTLGFALPAAIGPASVGIPTLALCGDGGPMFALGELATYVQEELPVTLVIVDDGGYGMLRFDQQVFGHPERGVDLVTPDWAMLAASFGIPCTEVADADEFTLALAASAELSGPSMIVQRATFFPPKSTSPRWFEDAVGPRETA